MLGFMTSNVWMIKRNELEIISKEFIIVSFDILSLYFPMASKVIRPQRLIKLEYLCIGNGI